MNKTFQEVMKPSSFHFMDESVILFKGRSSMKQYTPLKPTKRGYKVWARADHTCGYLYQFEIHCGKQENEERSVEDGLGPRVVKTLTSTLKDQNCLVVFDNFFTTVKLMDDLHENRILACGTVCGNQKNLTGFTKQKSKMEKGQHLWQVKGQCAAI